MKFNFKAQKDNGELVTGERESSDRFALAREMRGEGLTLIAAHPADSLSRHRSWLAGLFKGVHLKEKIVFANNLSSMIGAGLSLSRSLEILTRQTTNKYFQTIISDLLNRVTGGESFSAALSAYTSVFPSVFISMVEAGEESGNLPNSLHIVKEQLSKTYELQRKVRGAMIYPAIIISLMFVVGILMMIFLVPKLASTFADLNVPLPLLTRIFVGISSLMANHYFIFLSALVLLIISFISFLRAPAGQKTLDFILLRLPVIGELDRQVNAAITMRTISSLISSGVGMMETITITARVLQNFYFKQAVNQFVTKIEKGMTLSALLKEQPKLFPVLVGELTEVGEETGKMAEMLLEGAQFYEEEVDQATKNLATIIEPVIMIVIGTAVGFFVVAMIQPMYALTSAIQ